MARRDLLGNEILDRWITDLYRRLRSVGDDEAERMVREAMDIFDLDYRRVTPAALTRAINRVQGIIANPTARMITDGQRGLAAVMRDVIGGTYRGASILPRVRDGLRSGFSIPERDVARLLSRHHSFWVRNRYGEISEEMSASARRIISDELLQGSGRNEIARRLERHFGDGLKQHGYWRIVASNHVTRARSYALGATMEAAGIESYRIEAVLDDRTTHQCLFLHGKILPVSSAVQRATAVLRSSNPEAVLTDQPFIQDREDHLSVEFPGGRSVRVADIERRSSGMSPSGPTAQFARAISSTEMVDAAIGFPPYHHGCRTTVVAI